MHKAIRGLLAAVLWAGVCAGQAAGGGPDDSPSAAEQNGGSGISAAMAYTPLEESAAEVSPEEAKEPAAAPRRRGWFRRERPAEQPASEKTDLSETPDFPEETLSETDTDAAADGEIRGLYTTAEAMEMLQPPPPSPTLEAVQDYQERLEARLFERYANMPEHGGQVGAVRVVLSKPPEISLDGTMIRAEFDQLVYDPWGKRLPELEQEYFVVTFGAGGVQQVRSDPSIRVGLDMERNFAENAPLAADPFRNGERSGAFTPVTVPAMPEWWRPGSSRD